MVFKNRCVSVLWMKEALALEVLTRVILESNKGVMLTLLLRKVLSSNAHEYKDL